MGALFEEFEKQLLAMALCASVALLSACTTTTTPARVSDSAHLHQIIGELIVDIDTTTSHANSPDAFGSGPVSSKFEKYYDESVAEMSEEHRVEYFWAGMRHLRFQGGTMDLFLDVVSRDSAAEAFKERLRIYIDTSERLDRVSAGVENAKKVLAVLERRGK